MEPDLPNFWWSMEAPAPDSSLPALQRIQQLLSGSKIEKKGELLEGPPDILAEGIISYLTAHGFLDT